MTESALTLDEALALAIRLQQRDDWVAAHSIYDAILDAVPHHPDAVHYSGVLAHQEGRSDDALRLIEQSLALAPDRADWYSNLAIVLRDLLRLDEAIAACRRADLRHSARNICCKSFRKRPPSSVGLMIL